MNDEKEVKRPAVRLYVAQVNYNYEGFRIVGIYSTKRKANSALKRTRSGGDSMEVVTLKLDEDYDP